MVRTGSVKPQCTNILEIERGRHIDVPGENRICRLCSMGTVESEFHFLLVCPLYTSFRRDILTSTSWPSVAKFINIISSDSNRFQKHHIKHDLLQTQVLVLQLNFLNY